VETGLKLIAEGLDMLADTDLTPHDAAAAAALIGDVETLGSRIDALRVGVWNVCDRRELFGADGHGSMKVFARHVAQLSNPEANRRHRILKAIRALPHVGVEWATGRLNSCRMNRLASVYKNPRVRTAMRASEELLLDWAQSMDWVDFDALLTDWERFVDQDGAGDRNETNHDRRTASLRQEYDLSWRIEGRYASLQGAQLKDIFEHFLAAETDADWQAARAEQGDDATVEHLPRSEQQRRADALAAIFTQAAANPAGGAPPRVITDIVIDHDTFERETNRLAGGDITRTPHEANEAFENYRCSTLNGDPVDPTEAVAAALVGHVRRAIINSASVTIDLGRTQRLFTGPAAIAAKLNTTHCYWPGCRTPVRFCEIDHLDPHCRGGPTDQDNAGPLCSRHNRHKHTHGYTVNRDPTTGHWTIQRPDGTQLE